MNYNIAGQEISGALTTADNYSIEAESGTPKELSLRQKVAFVAVLLDDPNYIRFKPQMILKMLNTAQYSAVRPSRIPHGMIKTLDVSIYGLVLNDSGGFDIDALGQEAYDKHNGIRSILFNGRPCDKISEEEYAISLRFNHVFDPYYPVYYADGSMIYIKPFTETGETQTVDLKYRRRPRRMVMATDINDDVDCELEDPIQDIIIGLSIEEFRHVSVAATNAFNKAVDNIHEMNFLYTQTDSISNNINHNFRQSERNQPIGSYSLRLPDRIG